MPGRRARRPVRTPRPARIPAQGPFRGMRDSLDPSTADPQLARLLQNVYSLDPKRGAAVVGRPGVRVMGAQGGSSGARTGQFVGQFTKENGTEYTIRITGGKVETFNWGTRVWSEAVTAAQLAGAGIALSATARVYGLPFADRIIFSDGVNTPWMWDGTTGGGLTKLTACPVLYGPPIQYYAKVFGIAAADRTSVVWSEEGDATIGYGTGVYANNAWSLVQTSSDRLTRLVGTNEALFYARENAWDAVSGAVSADFQTSGVHAGYSEGTGTKSPAAVLFHGGRIYFLDAEGLPHVLTPGLGVQPLWEDFAETVSALDEAQLASAVAYHDPGTGLVGFAAVELAQAVPTLQIMVDPRMEPAQSAAIWRGHTIQAVATVKSGTGAPARVHLSSDGYAYEHGAPDGALWDDAFAGGSRAIEHVVEPAEAGYNLDTDLVFDRLDLSFRAQSSMTNMRLSYATPRGESQPLPLSLTSNRTRWNLFKWGQAKWSSSTLEQHVPVGLEAFGRWMRWRLQHAAPGEQFGLVMGQPRGRYDSDAPEIP